MAVEKILVAYATNAGSTEEVARVIAEELEKAHVRVDVRRMEDVADLAGYQAVIIGAPMILGWHRAAIRFLKMHHQDLANLPVAYFATAMSLTWAEADPIDVPVFVDPDLAKAPKNLARRSLKEHYTSLQNYLRPMLNAAPEIKPVSVAFLGGKLELFRLKWYQMLFVVLVIRAEVGDYRNFNLIRDWARLIYGKFTSGDMGK